MAKIKSNGEQLLLFPKFSEEKIELAEQQIIEQQKVVGYEVKEYTIELLVNKYKDGLANDTNDIYIPSYQRKFVWDTKRQSKFIESLLLGLPIPYLFLADSGKNEGRSEVIDGSQRIRTLEAFLDNKLVLKGLEKLNGLEGFRFTDLPLSRQRRFKKKTLRLIELSEKADITVRKDMFERINTTSVQLNEMQIRRGFFEGDFIDFINDCANNQKFKMLCPIPKEKGEKEEGSEMVLRFFAYSEDYQNFVHNVGDFLDDYTKVKKQSFDPDQMAEEFENMLDFVDVHFPYGFRKSSNHTSTPRVRFEAISVGVNLALKEKQKLIPTKPVTEWLNSKEFAEYTTSDAANNKSKVLRRIEYVRDQLLGR
jgi:Protein of unknown function DUF262